VENWAGGRSPTLKNVARQPLQETEKETFIRKSLEVYSSQALSVSLVLGDQEGGIDGLRPTGVQKSHEEFRSHRVGKNGVQITRSLLFGRTVSGDRGLSAQGDLSSPKVEDRKSGEPGGQGGQD